MRAVSLEDISDMAAVSQAKVASAYTSIAGAHKARDLGAQFGKSLPRDARGQVDFGKGGRALLDDGAGFLDECRFVVDGDLVGLGQHQLESDGALVEELEHLLIDCRDAMAGIDQHEDTGEAGPAPQIRPEQPLPLLDLDLRRLGI